MAIELTSITLAQIRDAALERAKGERGKGKVQKYAWLRLADAADHLCALTCYPAQQEGDQC